MSKFFLPYTKNKVVIPVEIQVKIISSQFVIHFSHFLTLVIFMIMDNAKMSLEFQLLTLVDATGR